MAGNLASQIGQILLPKGKGTRGGTAFTPTFNPFAPLVPLPQYRDHITDIYTTRQVTDSRALLNTLVNHDPDISAAVHAYLTIGESAQIVMTAFDLNNVMDVAGIDMANAILTAITTVNDYTVGFSSKPSLISLLNSFRYMCLLRGTIATELVLDKNYSPDNLRVVDSATLIWNETNVPGHFTAIQRPASSATPIDLDIPTFLTANYHQNPTSPYAYSPFVSALNTIAARQEVINELYRIMKVVGYPRLDISVVEDVLVKNAPPAYRNDPVKVRDFVTGEIAKIRTTFNALRSDQTLVHTDAVKAAIINDKNPGAGMQIQGVIEVLDSSNQAALKVMPAVVGKGSGGQVSAVESRLFAMSCDALNACVGDIMSQALTLAARLAGYQGRIVFGFRPIELRPTLELEPQKVMKAARLQQDLSLGIISDLEYTMELYGRPPLPGAPPLSGTGFLAANAAAASVNAAGVTPNSDPLGQSLAPPGGSTAAKSKTNSAAKGKTKLTGSHRGLLVGLFGTEA